jgi:hydrogenase 3 maturation protease
MKKNVFRDIFKGRVVIVGIGNPLRGDDGCGPAVIGKLKGRVRATCLDAGQAPENYTGKIVKEAPDTVLLVDAVHLGREPGTYEILEASEIERSGFTTHDMSPRMFIEYLKGETGARIYLVGVQPERVAFGSEMSHKVKESVEEITRLIKEVDHA